MRKRGLREVEFVAAAALALASTACSVAPAVPVELAPDTRDLALGPEDRLDLTIAVAHVQVGSNAQRDANAYGTWPGPSDLTTGVTGPPPLPEREYSSRLPFTESETLQRRISEVTSWLLCGGHPAPILAPPSDPSPSAVRAAAEAAGADLLLELTVLDYQAAWVERDTWWWPNFLLFYGPGLIPVVLIPDERYEVAIRAQVELVHVRTGRRIAGRGFVSTVERALNDPQRGWSLSGLLFLYPWFLDDGDFEEVEAALRPHATEALLADVAPWLRTALPAALRQPRVAELVSQGDAAQARTYALVVGASRPADDDVVGVPPQPIFDLDVRALNDRLRIGGIQQPHHRTLVGRTATRADVIEALADLGRHMLGHDRLVVYYAGYGQTDAYGHPSLTLDGLPMTLRELASAVAHNVPAESLVLFLLDTSFGGATGRTLPGGRPPDPDGLLEPLWLGHPRWVVLAATAPDQPAPLKGSRGHSPFAAALVDSTRADQNGDERLSPLELARWCDQHLTAEGHDQRVTLRGQQRRAPVLRTGVRRIR